MNPYDYRMSESYKRFEQSEKDSYTEGGQLGYMLDKTVKPDEYSFNEVIKRVANHLEGKEIEVIFIKEMIYGPEMMNISMTKESLRLEMLVSIRQILDSPKATEDFILETIDAAWDNPPRSY